MNVGKNWRIESDSMNVTLLQKKNHTRKDGTHYQDWEIHGHFATIKNALHELVNQGVRDTELKDLTQVITAIENLQNLMETCFKAS